MHYGLILLSDIKMVYLEKLVFVEKKTDLFIFWMVFYGQHA